MSHNNQSPEEFQKECDHQRDLFVEFLVLNNIGKSRAYTICINLCFSILMEVFKTSSEAKNEMIKNVEAFQTEYQEHYGK